MSTEREYILRLVSDLVDVCQRVLDHGERNAAFRDSSLYQEIQSVKDEAANLLGGTNRTEP